MEKANNTTENLSLRESKSKCHKTPEKKEIFREDKGNIDVRNLEREQECFDFRSPKRLKISESESKLISQKEEGLLEYGIFKTPEKKKNNNTVVIQNNCDKVLSPIKKKALKEESITDSCLRCDPLDLETMDEDLISEIDQAKLLIAATKNLPKSDKTPIKNSNSESPRRLPTNSPGTPGRQKRVELITLASPKSKMLKPM